MFVFSLSVTSRCTHLRRRLSSITHEKSDFQRNQSRRCVWRRRLHAMITLFFSCVYRTSWGYDSLLFHLSNWSISEGPHIIFNASHRRVLRLCSQLHGTLTSWCTLSYSYTTEKQQRDRKKATQKAAQLKNKILLLFICFSLLTIWIFFILLFFFSLAWSRAEEAIKMATKRRRRGRERMWRGKHNIQKRKKNRKSALFISSLWGKAWTCAGLWVCVGVSLIISSTLTPLRKNSICLDLILRAVARSRPPKLLKGRKKQT